MLKAKRVDEVVKNLSIFSTYISNCNKLNLTDNNIYAEGFIMNLFNSLYGLNLINLNSVTKNQAGLDLGDKDRKIGVQISAKITSKKIIDTYEKINSNYIENQKIIDIFSEKIIFFSISDNKSIKLQKNNLCKINDLSNNKFSYDDIILLQDIISEICNLYDTDYDKFVTIYELISDYIENLSKIIDDKIIVTCISEVFIRPAFLSDFKNECDLGDFKSALSDVISLLNTKIAKSNSKITIEYGINDLGNESIKCQFIELINCINYLRNKFLLFLANEKISIINENERFFVIANYPEIICIMNSLRAIILCAIEKIDANIGVEFFYPADYLDNYIRQQIDNELMNIKPIDLMKKICNELEHE